MKNIFKLYSLHQNAKLWHQDWKKPYQLYLMPFILKEKKKFGIEIRQLQILVTFQTLQFNSKFPLLILEFLSKIYLEAEGYHSTSSHRATRTIITISWIEAKPALASLRFTILFLPMLLSQWGRPNSKHSFPLSHSHFFPVWIVSYNDPLHPQMIFNLQILSWVTTVCLQLFKIYLVSL